MGSTKAEIGEVRSEQKKLAAVDSDKTAALSGLQAELSALQVRAQITLIVYVNLSRACFRQVTDETSVNSMAAIKNRKITVGKSRNGPPPPQ